MQIENYTRTFPDMHRELHRLYVSGDIVVVQLALQGTHLGSGGGFVPDNQRTAATARI